MFFCWCLSFLDIELSVFFISLNDSLVSFAPSSGKTVFKNTWSIKLHNKFIYDCKQWHCYLFSMGSNQDKMENVLLFIYYKMMLIQNLTKHLKVVFKLYNYCKKLHQSPLFQMVNTIVYNIKRMCLYKVCWLLHIYSIFG